MSDRDEEDETQIAVKHPLYPMPPRAAPAPYPDDDRIPDEDETLVALDRRAVPFDPRAMGRAMPAVPPPPRPAAGMPAALPPPRPAAGMAAALPPPAAPPRPGSDGGYPPAPGAGMPATLPPPRQPHPSQHDGFLPVSRTLTLPMTTDPRATAPLLPAVAPTAGADPYGRTSAPPSVPEGAIELAADGTPPIVVRFLLVCGVLTVLGLLALIYLQL